MTDRLSGAVIGLVLRPGLAFLILVSGTATAGHGQQFDPQVPHPAFPAGEGPRVLFDSAHFNLDAMSAFFDLLRKDGFRLSFQKKPWTPAFLEQADLFVISGPLAVDRDSLKVKGNDHYWWSDEGRPEALTSDEVLAVVRWVRAGGNLLVIVDHAPAPAASRRLLEALGVDARNSMTWDDGRRPPGYHPYKDNRRASSILFSRKHGSIGVHPILQGRNKKERIDRVATYVGSSLVGPLGSSPLLLLSRESFDYWKDPPERGGAEHRVSAAGRAQAVAFSLDKGRVVVVAEYTPFMATWGGPGDPDGKIGKGMAYAGAQDQQFVTNIMRWLVRVIP